MAERVGFSVAFNSEGLRYWPADFSNANGILNHRSGSATGSTVILMLEFLLSVKPKL
jgi:hypothetical protein